MVKNAHTECAKMRAVLMGEKVEHEPSTVRAVPPGQLVSQIALNPRCGVGNLTKVSYAIYAESESVPYALCRFVDFLYVLSLGQKVS